MATASLALCHGDYSPKNILTHRDGFTLVDYETAHLGDPTMDLGFFLSHLMLKAIKRHAERERYFDLTRAFWRGYGREVHFRSLAELMQRGIGHFGVCVLARIDGTSPVDGHQVFALHNRIDAQARLLSIRRRNVDVQLARRADAPAGTAGDECQDGVVKHVVVHIRLNDQGRTFFASGPVAVDPIHHDDV